MSGLGILNDALKRRFDGKGSAVKGGKAAAGFQLQGNGAELQAAGFLTAVKVPVSIEIIAEQRMTQGRQMGPDLVGTPGNKMDFQTGNRTAFQGLISGNNRFGIRFGPVSYADFCPAGILDQPRTAFSLRRLHHTADQTDIKLFQAALTKNILQDFQGFGRFRKQAEPAGFIIEAMAGSGRKGFRILLLYMLPAEIREGDASPGIRFHADPGTLVDQQDISILINHGKRRHG